MRSLILLLTITSLAAADWPFFLGNSQRNSIADSPLAKASPWVPPSSAARFRSSASRVGFATRA